MLIGNSKLLRRFLRNIYGQTLSIGNAEMFGKLGHFTETLVYNQDTEHISIENTENITFNPHQDYSKMSENFQSNKL